METPEILTDGKNTFEYDEEQYHELHEYLNRDFELLLLVLLVEAFENGENSITLKELLKEDYWKIDYIREEVMDTHDWTDIHGMVVETLIFIIEDLRLGKVSEVALTDYYEAKNTIPANAVKALRDKRPNEVNDTEVENTTMHYQAMFDSLLKLNPVYEERMNRLRDEWHSKQEKDGRASAHWVKYKEDSERLPFLRHEYKRHLNELTLEVPELIEIVFLLNENKIKELKEKLSEFLTEFSEDKHLNDVPKYQKTRLYFAKQLENFATYINKLPLVKNTVNVPFSILFDQGFEAVKVIKFLELTKRLEIRWSDDDHWHIEFASVPISPASLLGLETETHREKETPTEELKFDLSFSQKSGVLHLAPDNTVKIQGQVQKEILRILFEDPKNLSGVWSCWDISERLGADDVDEKAVTNATYQLNKKIQLHVPSVKDFLLRDKNTVQINPKYASKLK
jgi:hypothetical protein